MRAYDTARQVAKAMYKIVPSYSKMARLVGCSESKIMNLVNDDYYEGQKIRNKSWRQSK